MGGDVGHRSQFMATGLANRFPPDARARLFGESFCGFSPETREKLLKLPPTSPQATIWPVRQLLLDLANVPRSTALKALASAAPLIARYIEPPQVRRILNDTVALWP